MCATLPIRALVSGRELAIVEDLVRLRLGVLSELEVVLTRVDQQRRPRLYQVYSVSYGLCLL